MKIFGVCGWKNSGKTTLTERLVSVFTRRGYRIATIKHAHHAFDIDQPGTDSFRHREAGATETVILSSRRWALMHELREDEKEPSVSELLEKLSPCDLVLIEGFKMDLHPKIECRRMQARDRKPLANQVPSVVAVASDHPINDATLPVFDLGDSEAIADFIAAHVRLGSRQW